MATSQQNLGTGSTTEEKHESDLDNGSPDTASGELDVEKGEERSNIPAALDWDGPDDAGNPLNVSNSLLHSSSLLLS